jgi:hypothetical protein
MATVVSNLELQRDDWEVATPKPFALLKARERIFEYSIRSVILGLLILVHRGHADAPDITTERVKCWELGSASTAYPRVDVEARF